MKDFSGSAYWHITQQASSKCTAQ